MGRRWFNWLPFILLGALLLLWLWPLLAGESLFWGLPTLQFYPWRSYAFDELRAGRLPLWNPFNGGGAPLLANYQTAVFYPPNWLHLILPHVDAMNVLAVGHIVLAAAGMWRFGRCWTIPAFGRGISALGFAAGGYLVGRLGSFPTVAAAAWMPWLFCELHFLLIRQSGQHIVRLGLVTAMLLLAGHAQTAFYVLVGAGGYALWLGSYLGRTWRARFGLWAITAGAVLLGVGLAAIQLVPTAELLGRSARSDGLQYAWTTNFSYSPVRALTLVAPNLFGTPADGSYLTEGAHFEDTAYVGLLPLIAALAAVIWWWRSRADRTWPQARASVPFWAGMALLAFLLALGKNGFLFPLLYDVLPIFRVFQGPVRWLILAAFGLSMLAGIGVCYAWQRGRWQVFWSRLALAGGTGMALIAVTAGPYLLSGSGTTGQVMIRALAMLGITASGCALLALSQPEDTAGWQHLTWRSVALVFVAVDLGIAFYGLNPTIPAEFFAPQTVGTVEEASVLYMPEDQVQILTYQRFFNFQDYRLAVERWRELRQSLLPNLNMLDGIRMYNNFEPLDTQEHADAVLALEGDLPSGDGSLVALNPGDVPIVEPFGMAAVQAGGAVTALSIVVSILLVVVERFNVRAQGRLITAPSPGASQSQARNVL